LDFLGERLVANQLQLAVCEGGFGFVQLQERVVTVEAMGGNVGGPCCSEAQAEAQGDERDE
jgi:hypothetical protein